MITGRIFRTIVSVCFCVTFAVSPACLAADRSTDIRKCVAEIEGNDPITAALAVDQALRSNDPILRSIALEKALSHSDSRVRSLGFTYLVKTQKRIVVEAIATDSAISTISSQNDRRSLIDQLVLVVEFSEFNPSTSRFVARINRWGTGEGAVGQDGITITQNSNKITLRNAISGFLVGTASYRLNNTPGLIHLPAKAALP